MANVKEILRRLYNDLVVRRSSVRVLPARESADLTEAPIFLVGVYRSGTTLMRYVIDSHSRICCPPESFFMGPLSALINDEQIRKSLQRMGFDQDHVARRLRRFCLYFFENYAQSCGKPRWADKSPSYVDHLDTLLRLFPESQFVIIYRHGLDQAHSFTRGGAYVNPACEGYCRPGEDFRLGAVRYWREKTEGVMRFEDAYPEKCRRIHYERLCEDPEGQLKPIFSFLNEPWEPAVLEFYRFRHDKGAEDGRAAATRGFSVSKDHYRAWPPQLLKQCVELAEPVLSRLNYSIGEGS